MDCESIDISKMRKSCVSLLLFLLILGSCEMVPTLSRDDFFQESFDWKIIQDGIPIVTQWIPSGENYPFIQSSEHYSGGQAIQFGSSENVGSSTLTTQIEVEYPSYLTFVTKMDSTWGDFTFSCDDSRLMTYRSRSGQWFHCRYAIDRGVHTLRWSQYRRYDDYTHHAWIDDIEITSMFLDPMEDFPLLHDGTPMDIEWTIGGDSFPYMQSLIAYNGEEALQLGELERRGNSSLTTSISISERSVLSFWAYALPGDGDLYFSCNETRLLSVDELSQWTRYDYILEPGDHILEWEHLKSGYSSYNDDDSAWIAKIEITSMHLYPTQNFQISHNGSPMDVEWNFGGDSFPFLQSDTLYDGNDALQMGILWNRGDSVLETSLVTTEQSILSFWTRVDSNGWLRFYHNDNKLASVSKISEWIRYDFILDPGTHSLMWEHEKGRFDNDGQAWIDHIELTTMDQHPIQDYPIIQGGSPLNITWTLGGSSHPFLQSETTYQGKDTIQMGILRTQSDSVLKTTITLAQQRTISFWAMADMGSGNLQFSGGTGKLMEERPGNDWTQYSFLLDPGTHTLVWRYFKNYHNAESQVWIGPITLE